MTLETWAMMGVSPDYFTPPRGRDLQVVSTLAVPPGAVRPRKGLATATAACALAGLAACSSVPTLPPVPPQPAVDTGAVSTLPPYRFQVGDVLGVRLLLNPELNEEVTVRPDGRIS